MIQIKPIKFYFYRFSNLQESEGKNGTAKPFNHPFLQCWGHALGEFICIFIFCSGNILKKSESETELEEQNRSKFNPFLFLPAAFMHTIYRSFLFIALTQITASSYQIICGCSLIFTCVLSRIFLKRILSWTKWIGVFIIVIGKPIIKEKHNFVLVILWCVTLILEQTSIYLTHIINLFNNFFSQKENG